MNIRQWSLKRKIFFGIILGILSLWTVFHFVIAPSPSSPLFSLSRFKFILYPKNTEVADVFKQYAYEGMPRQELEKIILDAGGVYIRSGNSMDLKKNHSGFGYASSPRYAERLKDVPAKDYIDYNMPIFLPIDFSPGVSRLLTVHYDKFDKLRIMFVAGKIVFPLEK